MKPAPILSLSLAAAVLSAAGCASSPSASLPSPVAAQSAGPPSPDPRVGLKPGRVDSTRRHILEPAGEASWNMRLVSNSPPPDAFRGVTNSDLAFFGPYAIQGNYNGYMVWDISDPRKPTLKTSYLCPASQSDVSVYRNLLFVSAEAPSARIDCGTQGVSDPVSQERIRGIRIFDITDITRPKYLANVQTCRGSHTHTVVSDPTDPNNVYIYISGSSRVRPEGELRGCADLAPEANPGSESFRIEVIKVPLANPQMASVVSAPRIFQGLTAPPRAMARAAQDSAERAARGGAARGGRAAGSGIRVSDSVLVASDDDDPPARRPGGQGARGRSGPTQCHDITVYPAIGLAGGACGGYGLLLDISDAANPKRVAAVADSNFSFWHSATFSNDGSKVLFTDEWGGGSAPRCRATDKYEWGANAIFTISPNREMTFKSYYKMPAAQTSTENCVAHNGSLVPIPGREVMVQGWYQGGISVFDWTDPAKPYEIAFFDRGPLDGSRLTSAGSWSVYWYNGAIVSSEIARGLDVFELTPSPFLSRNEIEAARTVRFEYLNAQEQPKLVWPATFVLARAYLDQLARGEALGRDRLTTIAKDLTAAEQASGAARGEALTRLATQLDGEAGSSRDAARVRLLTGVLRELAGAAR